MEGSLSPDLHHDCETDMKFEQRGVCQKFSVNGKRRKETILIPGHLSITENKYGEYIEWKPDESKLKNGNTEASSTSQNFGSKYGASGGIQFHASKGDGRVEIKPETSSKEFLRPIKIELPEIRSFIVPPKAVPREIIFILSDGTTLNPFIFERGSPENLVIALERSLRITKSRSNSNGLYMVGLRKESAPTMPPSGVLPQGVAEILGVLPPEHAHNVGQIWGFMKEMKNDPYATACTTLAKFGHMALNGELPINVFPGGSSHQMADSVLRNGKLEESLNSDANELEADYTTNEEGYEVIFKPEKMGVELPPLTKTFRGQPLSQEQWLNYLDRDGRISNMNEIRKIVFYGGVEPMIRKHVWPILLGVYDSKSTYEERQYQFSEKTCYYNRMKMQWATVSEDQEERFSPFRDFKSLIEKDVSRTDRTLDYFKGENSRGTDILRNILMTYMMYNFNLGYVQGMSDILAPILMETQDEILAFWVFVKFMDLIETNFEMSQEGMQRQLKDSYTLLQLVDPKFSAYLEACDASNMYFAFRWLLIWFKREFTFQDTLILWEALWTGLPGPNFHLFIGLSILEQHSTTIMENKFGLSEILRHVNDLAMRIDLELTLTRAEAMYLQVSPPEVTDKLPNKLRVILGLPEKEEPLNETMEIVEDTDGAASSSQSTPLHTSNAEAGPSSSSGGGDGVEVSGVQRSSGSDSSLERQYEMGVNQFM
ncbi:unnamed protein product [Orchesella dallaii]